MKKKFYEITLESSSGTVKKTLLVQARSPQSALKKAKKEGYSAFFGPVGKVLNIKEVIITNLRGD